MLRLAITSAQDRGLCEMNPVLGVRLPRGRGRTHEPWTYLLPDEQRKLLGCIQIPWRERVLIRAALYSGLREGELWALELRDVNVERGVLTIRYGSKGGPTKGRKIRHLPILAPGLEAVKEQLVLLRGQRNPHGLLWPTERGYRRQPGKPPRHWEHYLEVAGVHPPEQRHDGRHVRWHDLRHSCASSLVAGWWGRAWRLEEVRGYLGHSSVTVTERYAHLAPSLVAEAAADTPGLPAAPMVPLRVVR
jgi:integrase